MNTPQPSRLVRNVKLCGILFSLFPGLTGTSAAHEIPNDVTIQIYVRPEAGRLTLLIRSPLESMRDIEWPTRGPGYLELEAARNLLHDAVAIWLANDITVFEDGIRLDPPEIVTSRVSLPSDSAFTSYAEALKHLSAAPLDPATDLYWRQALVDVLLTYSIESDRAQFSIRPGLERLGLRVLTVIRFLSAEGAERVFQFRGDPGRVVLDPRWHQAALTFVRLGFDHILGGYDHLLFLLCLVIPVRQLRSLVTVVTAFTLAHSMTLFASAFGMTPNALWFPPLIETLIAGSIVFMAIGNVLRPQVEHRWLIAFGFGLVHGFGFSFVLSEGLQLAGDHLSAALFSFNVGVELGQLLVLFFLIPVIWLLLRMGVSQRVGVIVLSILVGHTAWHWMVDRGSTLADYSWSSSIPVTLPLALRWLLLLVIIGGAGWLFSVVTRPLRRDQTEAM